VKNELEYTKNLSDTWQSQNRTKTKGMKEKIVQYKKETMSYNYHVSNLKFLYLLFNKQLNIDPYIDQLNIKLIIYY
jgi:hypothetical protein